MTSKLRAAKSSDDEYQWDGRAQSRTKTIVRLFLSG
jgi:hypothetical protein